MGKTSKWLRNFLTGKKDREKEKQTVNQPNSLTNENPNTTPISIPPPTTPKEKRRWSFRRSSATSSQKEFNCTDPQPPAQQSVVELENEQRKHAMAMAAATAAAADAAVAAAQAAAAVIRLSAAAGRASIIEEAAAIKIQSVFRSYLARKALCALKGLVKLQALVRGHLVRKQATATLRCMQALVTVQARARAQRIRMAEEFNPNSNNNQKQLNHRKTTPDNNNRFRHTYHEMDRGMEENIKIVEMDLGESKGSTKSRNSYSTSNHPQTDRFDHRFSTHSAPNHPYSNHNHRDISPSPSLAFTETSPRACSGHFEDYSFGTAQSSPQHYSAMSKPPHVDYAESLAYDNPFYPSYMANTESSRAKARSQSAPKSRPEGYERQPSGGRRRMSLEGRNVPRAVRMQRSSSHVGSAAQNIQYPWSVKLDRSSVSLKDSECGSTSTVQTYNNYCRSLVGVDVNGNRY